MHVWWLPKVWLSLSTLRAMQGRLTRLCQVLGCVHTCYMWLRCYISPAAACNYHPAPFPLHQGRVCSGLLPPHLCLCCCCLQPHCVCQAWEEVGVLLRVCQCISSTRVHTGQVLLPLLQTHTGGDMPNSRTAQRLTKPHKPTVKAELRSVQLRVMYRSQVKQQRSLRQAHAALRLDVWPPVHVLLQNRLAKSPERKPHPCKPHPWGRGDESTTGKVVKWHLQAASLYQ